MIDRLGYNERAWAIDLISDINRHASSRKRPIARAGGEESLKGSKGSKNTLFPDVILFGDDNNKKVRHGWELKFPETSLDDSELIKNAVEKAKRFGVNSLLVWNVNEAKLYVKDNDGETFNVLKEWGPLGINSREEVRESKEKWQNLLEQILDDLNDFFDRGVLSSASVEHIFAESALAGIINEYCGLAASSIRSAANANASIDAQAKIWWGWNAAEYGKKSSDKIDYTIIARISLTNWVNKFLFCHYLKKFNSDAKMVETIVSKTPIEKAAETFSNITDKADFMQVFKPEIFSENIGQESWDALCEFNEFLITLRLEEVPQDILQNVVESGLKTSRRKFAGQYSTPYMLAKLLASLAIENRSGNVIDPCCGTGTIPKAAYELKVDKGQSRKDALSTVWASDKFQFPLQLCTIALADPLAMGEIVQIFKKDVFDLEKDNKVEFTDPTSGQKVTRSLGKIDTILSNLPFVRFEDMSSPQI